MYADKTKRCHNSQELDLKFTCHCRSQILEICNSYALFIRYANKALWSRLALGDSRNNVDRLTPCTMLFLDHRHSYYQIRNSNYDAKLKFSWQRCRRSVFRNVTQCRGINTEWFIRNETQILSRTVARFTSTNRCLSIPRHFTPSPDASQSPRSRSVKNRGNVEATAMCRAPVTVVTVGASSQTHCGSVFVVETCWVTHSRLFPSRWCRMPYAKRIRSNDRNVGYLVQPRCVELCIDRLYLYHWALYRHTEGCYTVNMIQSFCEDQVVPSIRDPCDSPT